MAEPEPIQDRTFSSIKNQFLDSLRKVCVGIMVHDLDGRLLLADERTVCMTGFTQEELLGRNVGDLIVGLDVPLMIVAWKTPSPSVMSFERKELRHKDGTALWVEVESERTFYSGQPCILNRVRDLEKMEAFGKHLETIEERFSSLVDLIPDLIFRMKEDGEIIEMYCSGRSALLDQPVVQCVGKNIRDVFIGASVWRILECWSLAAKTRQPQVFDFKFVNGKQESFYEVRCLMGGLEEAVFLLRDVTERKTSEKKINELLFRIYDDNEALRNLDRMKDDFLSQVSHELRTPLTSILGYQRLLLGGAMGILSPGQVEFVQTSIRNAIRLHDLVNNLLDISRTQSDQFVIVRNRVRVSLILGNALGTVKNLLDEKKIKIDLKLPDDFEMAVDEPKLERVFINLLGNAVKFTPVGGRIEMGAETGAREGRKGAFFWVKDDGVGIPAKDLENIFKQFFQVDNTATRKVGGTGLGLAICKKIVEGHEGIIWAESVEGQGSTLHFFIPEDGVKPSGGGPAVEHSKG